MIITRELATKVRDVVAAGLSNGLGQQEPGKMCVEAAVCFALGLPHGDDPGCVDEAVRGLKIRLNDASGWPSNAARANGLRRLAIAQLGSKDTIDTREFVRRVAEMTIRTMVPIAMRAAATRNPKHAEALEAAALKCEQEGTIESARNAQRVARAANAAAYAANAAANAAAYANAAANAAAYAAYANAAADAANAAAYANAAADAANAADAAAYANAAANAANAAADAANAAADAANAAAYAANAAAYAANAAANAANAAANAANAAARVRVLSAFAEAVVQILIDLKAPGCEFLDLVPVETV